MEKPCYRCGAPVTEEAPFCPNCGAPQIRVSSQPEPSPAAGPVTPPEPQVTVPLGLGVSPQTGQIQWKIFLRTAWPIAALAGVTVGMFSGLGLLIILPLSVIIGVWLYRKHHVGPLRAGQGAKLGMTMGLISFAAFAALSVAALATNTAVRQELIQDFNLAIARNPDPRAQQLAQDLINSPQGVVVLITMGLLFLMVLLLLFTAITGAVAASTLGSKKP